MFRKKHFRYPFSISRIAGIIVAICGLIIVLFFTPLWVWMTVLGFVLIGIGVAILFGWR